MLPGSIVGAHGSLHTGHAVAFLPVLELGAGLSGPLSAARIGDTVLGDLPLTGCSPVCPLEESLISEPKVLPVQH